MERARGARGRFVRTERPVEEEGGQWAGELAKAPRPGRWSAYTKARFAEALPELMHVLVREAKKGSVAHMKLLVVICGLDQSKLRAETTKRPEKNLEQILLEDWKREEEREAAAGEARALWRDGDEEL